ncbi:unnamed protein product, partial [Rotaria magnacalcarata]
MRNSRRLQIQIRDLTRQLEESKPQDTLSNQTVKEWQTKLKAYEQDIEQLSEDKDNLERQFRQIQTER